MALSSEGRSIMDEARAALAPTAADRARLRVALAMRMAASAAATTSPVAARPLLGLLSSKLMGGLASGLAIALCGSLGYVWLSAGPERQLAGRASEVAASLGAPSPPPSPRPPTSASALEHGPEASSPGIAASARAMLPAAPRRPAKASPSSSAEVGPDVDGEVALLAEAQKALAAGKPAFALQFLDQHARSYPRGALAPERAVARVIALCKLGRIPAARRDAAAFLPGNAASPLSDRVRAACGDAFIRPQP